MRCHSVAYNSQRGISSSEEGGWIARSVAVTGTKEVKRIASLLEASRGIDIQVLDSLSRNGTTSHFCETQVSFS